MDFAIVTENFKVVVMLACLGVGYIVKTSFMFIPDKYIPAILAVLGATVNTIVGGLSVESIVYGGIMGLAATGTHQAFKQWIEKK